nr:hypothetical protein HK105_000643 [Polyrhizophydium stewartii]
MPLVAQAAEPQTYGMVSGFVSSETAPASKEAVLSVDPFLYLFLDFSARHPDNELPRHQLAQFGGLSLDKPVPLADIASVPIMRFPSLPGYFECWWRTSSFYMLRVRA